jgi:hypothetical protein
VTITPAEPLGPMMYGGAAAGTVSTDVATVKLEYVPLVGFVTPATVTVSVSPAAIAWPVNVRLMLPATPAVLATICQLAVMSVTSQPVTLAKPVFGCARVIVPPAATALVALNVTVYVAVAFATEGDTERVRLVTELPTVTVFVVSGVPVLAPPTLANGAMVMLLDEDPGGFVPVPVMVTVAPDGISELSPKVTTLQPVSVGGTPFGVQLLDPDNVTLDTVTPVAVPPDGV